MQLLTVKETAARLTCAPSSLYVMDFRRVMDLRAIRIGARGLRFLAEDVEKAILRRKEVFDFAGPG